MKPREAFILLDRELSANAAHREILICGGAALIAQDVVARETKDADVIYPDLDTVIVEAAERVAKANGFPIDWLNNGVAEFRKSLPLGWGERTLVVFQGQCLIVRSLGRLDLLRTKLLGACDRQDDVRDIVAMGVTDLELEEASKWVLRQDAAEVWPEIVQQCLVVIKHRRDRGKS